MSKVYIVEGLRTPFGKFGGTVKDINPAELGAHIVKEIVKRTGINPNRIDEVQVGNVLPAGQGQNIGRQVAVKAGLPIEVPGYTINIACGSGMKAVMNGFSSIKAGTQNLIIAGGAETMSRTPHIIPSANSKYGHKMGEFKAYDHLLLDGLNCAFDGNHMGVTAENIAAKYGITREEQDAFALLSQQKALRAQEAGLFAEEIVPYVIHSKKGDIVFAEDEHINKNATIEGLQKLSPAFIRENGTVTAGNASGINDGASFVLLASEEAVKEFNLKPIAEVIGIGQGGVDPKVMGLGPTPAIRHALKHAGLKITDMDLIELNEAFAAQSLGVIKELTDEHNVTKEWLLERTNVNGGAIALGHPVGCSGNRIIIHLVRELRRRNQELGLASLCIGGGMGVAVVVKAINE